MVFGVVAAAGAFTAGNCNVSTAPSADNVSFAALNRCVRFIMSRAHFECHMRKMNLTKFW